MQRNRSDRKSDPFLNGAGHFPGISRRIDCGGRSAAVLGGAMGGLAAAHALHRLGYTVTLYERQSYAEKRVNCGEAMTAASAIPLEKVPDNGFVHRVDAMDVLVYSDSTASRRLVDQGRFSAADSYVTDRNVVERRWAEQLARAGVDIRDEHAVNKREFVGLTREHDLVVDATGQPSIASRVADTTDEYAGYMTALNADVEGDFAAVYPDTRIVLENHVRYAWAFPKSPTRANVGIGWAQQDRPDDYMAALEAACERNGWPTPTAAQTNVAIIPEGPSLDPARTYLPEWNTVRVGDAAGIANRFSGKGISQAIHSAYLMAALAAEDRLDSYPTELYALLRSEYLLAAIVRGVLEQRRPNLLGAIVRTVSGIDIEDADRTPSTVLSQIARHPRVFARVFSNSVILRRIYDAYTGNWEYRSERGPYSSLADALSR